MNSHLSHTFARVSVGLSRKYRRVVVTPAGILFAFTIGAFAALVVDILINLF